MVSRVIDYGKMVKSSLVSYAADESQGADGRDVADRHRNVPKGSMKSPIETTRVWDFEEWEQPTW